MLAKNCSYVDKDERGEQRIKNFGVEYYLKELVSYIQEIIFGILYALRR